MMDMKRIYNILLIMILSLFLLPLGGCFDSDINRSMYEADGEEMQRENHIVGATLKGMQGLVIPTREHLYSIPNRDGSNPRLPIRLKTCTRSTAI